MGWSFPERVLAKTPSGQIIPVEPWDGGLSLENRQSLMAEASRRVEFIAQQLGAHPDCLFVASQRGERLRVDAAARRDRAPGSPRAAGAA